MKLYHGTREGALALILRNGIKPRGNRSGNWEHSVNSHPDAVYLTSAYAMHYAGAAIKRGAARRLILELDVNRLDHQKLAPDEDFLEQATRRSDEFREIKAESMTVRTKWFRKRLREFQHLWRASVDGLGTCCHFGVVPPEAITRYALVPPDHPLVYMSDPSIVIPNYQIMGSYYRAYSGYIFGDPPKVDPNDPFSSRHTERLGGIPRDGIEVFDVTPELMASVGV